MVLVQTLTQVFHKQCISIFQLLSSFKWPLYAMEHIGPRRTFKMHHVSFYRCRERDASHRSRITLRVDSQFTGSREKIGDQDPNSVPGLFSLSMPPKDLQIHRWGWQLTSQLIIKAEIDALHIQFQKLQIEPVVVIHPIIPAFRRLKKVGYIVSPRTACTI